MLQAPARPGMPVEEVDTPALVVDLDVLERNLSRMAQFVDRAGVRLRAHAKTHKCATIARMQMELGAEFARASDEHGRLDVSACNRKPELGEKIWLIPGHCDPTVNLHEWIVAVRDGVVEEVWPVEARGGDVLDRFVQL